MRKIFLIALVYIHAAIALGQDTEIAKLLQAIAQHPQPDTVRVNLLNEMAMISLGQADELEELATEALTISRKIGYA
jgi:hypothetical protein